MQWRNKWSTLIYLLVPVMFMLILFAIQKASSGPHGTFAFFFSAWHPNLLFLVLW